MRCVLAVATSCAVLACACAARSEEGTGLVSVEPLPPPKPVEVRVEPVPRIMARVVFAKANAWIEVSIDGTGDDARKTCDAVVRAAQHRAVMVLERGCEPLSLPATGRTTGAVLASAGDVDVVELAMAGVTDASASAPGTVTHFAWFPTDVECRRMLAKVDEVLRAQRADAARSVEGFLRSEIAEGEREEARVCERSSHVAATPCAARDEMCKTEHDRYATACAREHAIVETLRARVTAPPEPPASPYTCRDAAGR